MIFIDFRLPQAAQKCSEIRPFSFQPRPHYGQHFSVAFIVGFLDTIKTTLFSVFVRPKTPQKISARLRRADFSVIFRIL